MAPRTLTGPESADLTPPVTTVTIGANWLVTLTAEDTGGSDVKEIFYTTEAPPKRFTRYTGPFTLPANGHVTAYAVDNAGNTEAIPIWSSVFVPAIRK